MRDQRLKGSAGLVAIIIIAMLVVFLAIANRWLKKETGEIVSIPTDTSIVESKPPRAQDKKPKILKGGEVIREARLSPDRKIEISVFYQGGVEIARYKYANGKVYDLIGEIPDGKVQFINKSNETYGVEFYRNGKRHGAAKVFYRDDQLKQELEYQYGKLLTNKEYYHDGIVRMEVDYSDARGASNKDDPEVGIGKVYTRHGTVKFEWFLVNSEPVGFKKSYDQNGVLMDEVYFDEYGQIIEPEAVSVSDNTPESSDVPVATNILVSPDTTPKYEKLPKQIFVPTKNPDDM